MKRKLIFILSLLLGTLAFTSCEKSVYDADKQPQKENWQGRITQTEEVAVSTIPKMDGELSCSKICFRV